jgi:hypothetical protein
LTPRETNLCGVVRWRAELLRASRGATITPFLIASGQLLEIELTRSKQTRKYFLIASFSGVLRGASNSPIGRLAFPGVRGSRITGHESRFTNCASRFTRNYPNQSLAKHNRKPTQMIKNKQQRSKSIASFCRVFLGSEDKGAQLKLAATNSTAKSTSPACPSGKQAAATKSKERAQAGVPVPRSNHESQVTNHKSRITSHDSLLTNHYSRLTSARIDPHRIPAPALGTR